MKTAPAAPLRRLAPLAAGVLLAHLVLLELPDRLVAPARPAAPVFATRTVAAPVPAAAPAAAPAPVPEAPSLAARTPPAGPAPAPRGPAPTQRPGIEQVAPPVAAEVTPEATPEANAAATAPPPPASPASPTVPPTAFAIPAPARHRYEVVASRYGITLHGEAELHWRHDGSSYEAQLALRSPILPGRTERSTGEITAEGLAPSYYHQKSRGEQAAHFERDQGRIVFSTNRPSAELAPGMQDRLSVVLQLAAMIGGRPADFPAGSEITIPTAGTRDAEPWTFRAEGEEDLHLPGGEVRALKLQRRARKEYDQQVELWLAPRLDYAPVRLRLTNPNGDTVDQRWSSTDRG